MAGVQSITARRTEGGRHRIVEQPQCLDVAPDGAFTDAEACHPEAPVELVRPFTATHWGTQVMTVRDPDGRLFRLEAPADSDEKATT